MALYVILAKLTESGAKDLKGIMQRRPQNVRELEQDNIHIISDYVLMGGDYDFLYIVEAPDNETILRRMAQDTQSGVLKFHTMPASRLNEFAKMVGAPAVDSSQSRTAG